MLQCQRLSSTITKSGYVFVGQESGYFCWSSYAIFHGINIVSKPFPSIIQKKMSLVDHKLYITENSVGVPSNVFFYNL